MPLAGTSSALLAKIGRIAGSGSAAKTTAYGALRAADCCPLALAAGGARRAAERLPTFAAAYLCIGAASFHSPAALLRPERRAVHRSRFRPARDGGQQATYQRSAQQP